MTTWTCGKNALGNNRFYTTWDASNGAQTLMERSLNDVMEFDRVIHVDAAGNVSDDNELYAPEVLVELDADGYMVGSDSRDGVDVLAMPVAPWVPMAGYTGQDRSTSKSWIMHSSEFIGGGLERDILAQPGYYVAVTVDGLAPDEYGDGDTLVGWAVLYQEARLRTMRQEVLR